MLFSMVCHLKTNILINIEWVFFFFFKKKKNPFKLNFYKQFSSITLESLWMFDMSLFSYQLFTFSFTI